MKAVTMIAVSFFFSAWGDRLWRFAVGVYFVKLTPGSLQLAAIYGLVLTANAILFSSLVGDWIDRTNRLKAVRLLLILSNLFVFLCALCILVYLYKITTHPIWLKVMQALIILLGALANLTGVGEKICVSKDWIVVVCKHNKDTLTNANALLRRIDLSVAILAPVGVGLLVTVVSDLSGIIFICSWNVVSVFVEYLLLLHVYRNDSNLHHKGEVGVNASTAVDNEDENNKLGDKEPLKVSLHTSHNTSPCPIFVGRFKALLSGWKVYQRQPVVLAGFALAWLFLTSLNFGEITISYAYALRLKEVYISLLYALASVCGIAGTFVFPIIRKKIGLVRTGLVGIVSQILMLSICVVSIFLPGSPSTLLNNSYEMGNYTLISLTDMTVVQPSNISGTQRPMSSSTEKSSEVEYTSIMVFMIGLILSRFGLWISDLTITQLQQENVPEVERGTVGGVQYAVSNMFYLCNFIVTICFPYPRQFWILILMSTFAVLCSFITYLAFNLKLHCVGEIAADDSESEELKTVSTC